MKVPINARRSSKIKYTTGNHMIFPRNSLTFIWRCNEIIIHYHLFRMFPHTICLFSSPVLELQFFTVFFLSRSHKYSLISRWPSVSLISPIHAMRSVAWKWLVVKYAMRIITSTMASGASPRGTTTIIWTRALGEDYTFPVTNREGTEKNKLFRVSETNSAKTTATTSHRII